MERGEKDDTRSKEERVREEWEGGREGGEMA